MKPYVDLLHKILTYGEKREDRTGVGTLSIFGGQVEFDLRERFPLVTIKKTLWKSAFTEMLWFLRGEPNTKYLKEHGINIWDPWADENGNLGPIYGVQWRHWPGKLLEISHERIMKWANDPTSDPEVGKFTAENYVGSKLDNRDGSDISVYQEHIDQIKVLIDLIKTQPRGRRHIVTAWQPAFLKEMGLPPCHRDFQCYVSNDGHLDLMMSIRSQDMILGFPFNAAQYALLTHLIARATNLKPRRLIINEGDHHIYLNHVDDTRKMLLEREPVNSPVPVLVFKTNNVDIDGYKPDDFDVLGYAPHPFIKFPIAV